MDSTFNLRTYGMLNPRLLRALHKYPPEKWNRRLRELNTFREDSLIAAAIRKEREFERRCPVCETRYAAFGKLVEAAKVNAPVDDSHDEGGLIE